MGSVEHEDPFVEAETPIGGEVAAEAFEIVREVGRGGMATIFLARETAPPHRAVALKVVHPHMAGDAHLVERFKHEVRAHVGLAHPCVVQMIGWGHDAGGRLFMAMEFVDGPTLKDVLLRRRPLPVDLAVHVAARMARGLAAAHAAGIVHRDVKPANVMVARDGRVKLADFGISKTEDMTRLTSTGSVIGTPAYMSPEQALGRSVDARSDLFSLGVVLYEMLVGVNPFQADNPATTLSRVVQHRQRHAFEVLPHVPPSVEEILERLLAKQASDRWGSATEVGEGLDRVAAEEGLAGGDDSLAAYLADPEGTAAGLDRARAQRHFDLGVEIYRTGAQSEAAAWHLFLATILDPSSSAARTWLEQVSSERGFRLEGGRTGRMDELEARLQQAPDDMAVILQLAKLHKAQGNFLEVIRYWKRARALRPPDRYTQGQIETLVSAPAATAIEAASGRDVTATLRALRADPPRGEGAPGTGSAEAMPADARPVVSTAWLKAAAAALGLVGGIALLGFGFDLAARAAGGAPERAGSAPPVDLDFDRGEQVLERARELEDKGAHPAAEAVLRTFLEEGEPGAEESEALFLLGNALERQGDREEALETHRANAESHEDDWGARSAGRRGELLLLQGDLAGARAAYDVMARATSRDLRDEARVEMAGLIRKEGRPQAAIAEYDALLPELQGRLRDVATLDLADTLAETGDARRATELYAQVRDTTDHRGDLHARAVKSLRAMAPSDAPAAGEQSAETAEADDVFEAPAWDPVAESDDAGPWTGNDEGESAPEPMPEETQVETTEEP